MQELYAHQQEIVDGNSPRLGLFHAPGLGKTITLLELCKKNNVLALIIVPKGIKPQWEEYVAKGDIQHHVITKETFRRDVQLLPKYKAVIVDEAHHFSSTKSGLFKALYGYLKYHNVHYRWFATGTPYRSSPMNIYALGKLLGYEWNYWNFFNKFFTQVNMGSRMVPVQKKNMEKELEDYVAKIGVTLAMEDVVDVPSQTFKTEILDLTEEQIKAIEELEEPVPITRFTKIHCIEQGFAYGDEYTDNVIYPSNKNNRVIELCKRYNTIAIIARYTLQIQVLYHLLSKKFPNRPIYIISGQTPNRFDIVNKINESNNCIVLIQGQCSEGYEMPGVEAMVFASLSWSHVDHVQMKARILRMNALKKNDYYYLISGDIDAKVHETIMNHQDFHERLYDKSIV